MEYRLSIKHLTIANPGEDWLVKLVSEEIFPRQKLQVEWDNEGKPWLKKPAGFFVSGSDSGSYVAAAVADKPVGVDIEYRKPRIPELLLAITNDAERLQLKQHGTDAVLAAWTAKEAVQKADAKIYDMTAYRLTVDPANHHFFAVSRGSQRWRGQWLLESDYICALAIQQ